MASTRASTPASEGGSPEPLTPRSKIKALLDAVDNSEDEEPSAQHSKSFSRLLSGPRGLSVTPLTSFDTQSTTASDDEESDIETKPRGRLAARMHAAVAPTQNTDEEAPIQDRQPESDVEMLPAVDDDDDEDELPVAPRRRAQRAGKNTIADMGDAVSLRSPSPGLFVSPLRPSPSKHTENMDDDSLPALKSDRFKALVERKKQERLAREAAEEERNAERRARQERLATELEQMDSDKDNVSDITDDEGGRKLTQENRPARKASKKAVEEMNRETQRMARNMQLAHEAKTRKKISKSSLFERFNFRPAGEPEPKTASSSRPATPPTDVDMKNTDTPPSSPPVGEKQDVAQTPTVSRVLPAADVEDNLKTPTQPRLDKGKDKAVVIPEEKVITQTKKNVRVKMPREAINTISLDSDDELEITGFGKGKIDAVFDNVPKQDTVASHSMQALRALAQLKSPGKGAGRSKQPSGMTASELETSLHMKARQQAKLEREKRMNMLKAQGVVVQTAEERERQMQEVEDIVAKARDEAEQIMAQERAEAKNNKDGKEVDPLAWDDSDDEEYQASADEDDNEDEAADAELSGSEDEEEGEEEEETIEGAMLLDGEASEGDVSEEEVIEQTNEIAADEIMADEDDEDLPTLNQRRARKNVMVLSDDEAEAEVEATPRAKSTIQATPNAKSSTTPNAPSSVLRSAKKNFIPGLPVQGPAGLGLTQIFAGTMDDSQFPMSNGPTQSMMPDFDNFPDSNFSASVDGPDQTPTQLQATQNVETQATTQGVQLNFSQSQMRGLDSLLREVPPTQLTEMMEPSQDGGFQDHTPLKERFVDAPHSTVDTLVLPEDDVHDSPLVRRGRLRRKMESVAEDDELPPTANSPSQPLSNAFGTILEGAKKEKKRQLIDEFNRKKSKAKEMVEDQAEESEDEYRGLGGADGEDSDDESVASVKEMIDDAEGNNLDEGKLAAFYADRERANDEKQVEKLFKDITSGMLRRKRGADYDLSDSDDGGEARRKMKRRQFAKMQKALFSDERVKKMAENPGNQAFLRSIEDHGSDDEMDFLNIVEEAAKDDSQSQSQDQSQQFQVVPNSQPIATTGDAPETRAPANMRRTKAGRKPANIGEVRETLSNLLEDGREMSIIPATEIGSDSEDEEHSASARNDKENHAPNPRRTNNAIVDRISLKRNTSSMSTGSSSRLAYAAQASSSSSFKVPALLRRATTNSLQSSSASSSGAWTPMSHGAASGGFGDSAKIKKAASKKSGINAFARENERRAKIHENERKREEKKVKGAEQRLGVVGGLLGRNAFE